MPSVKRKVDAQMNEARRDIEAKLVPSGPAVTRHLVLPASGRDQSWIESEMDIMDVEGVSKTNWKHGKISGAVYHGGEDLEVRPQALCGIGVRANGVLHGFVESYYGCCATIYRQQPLAPGCFPR